MVKRRVTRATHGSVKRYKELCRYVHRLYGAALNMSYFDSCACVDDVYFGHINESELFELLDEALEG